MPLINQSIPNLSQGVSQQPDNIRHPGQGETQSNMLSSVVDGLVARPPSKLVGELGSSSVLSEDCFIHPINRDPDNRHVLVIPPNSSTPLIYDTVDGTAKTIYDAATGTGTSFDDYINTANPRENLQAVTVADTTYILNKTTTVGAMDNTSAALSKKAVVFVKQGDYQKEYMLEIEIGGTSHKRGYRSGTGASAGTAERHIGGAAWASLSAATDHAGYNPGTANDASTELIAQGVYGAFWEGAIANVTFTLANIDGETPTLGNDHGPTTGGGTPQYNYTEVTSAGAILVEYSAGAAFNITAHDGIQDTGLGVIYNEVNNLSDLPSQCFHNFIVKVKGDTTLVQDDYYVKFVSKDSGASTDDYGEGTWVETVAPSTAQDLDEDTLPAIIAPQTSDPTKYYYALNTWGSRTVGDTTTNAQPSFVGETIEQLFFFKNRLGMLSGQNVLFSENDNYTNFFRTSTLSLLDSDRIDVGVSHTKVSFLKHARAFQEKLLLFSNQSQFVLRGNNLLTPSTVNISPVTEYQVQSGVEPLALGQHIYFPFNRGSYQGLYEYYVDATTDTFRAEEITAHIPKYLPSDFKHMAGSQTEDCIAITTTASGGSKDIYVYKFFWAGNDKIQSSWSKFTMTHDILGIFFIESDLYIIIEDGTGSFLERIQLESGLTDTGFDYTIRLDSRQTVDDTDHSVSYDSAADTTTITPGVDCTGIEVWSEDGNKATEASSTATTITVNGDWRSATLTSYIGYPISWEYEFTRPEAKQATARDGLTTSKYVNQIVRTGAVEYAETGHFTVEVSKKYRDTFTHVFNPTFLGADSKTGTLVLEDGSFRYPIYSNVKDLTVKLKGSSALPAKFLSAEFESTLAARSRRYAG